MDNDTDRQTADSNDTATPNTASTEPAMTTGTAPVEAGASTVTTEPATTPEAATVTTTEPAPITTEPVVAPVAPVGNGKRRLLKQYGWAFLAILVMALILWYGLERQGRVNTGVFTAIQNLVNPEPAAAIVNGVRISMSEYERNRTQLLVGAGQQGADTTDQAVLTEINQQAIDTLINTELLRQAAAEAGIAVTPEQIEARYQEVLQSVGSAEVLAQRMQEIGIDESILRRDIEGEILIQTFLEQEVDTSSIVITPEEVEGVYAQAGGAENGLPPLDEVREQIEAQLRFSKEQELVNSYIESLRSEASIEVKV